jgi:nitroimidazol reductase NimA-like FMN-containing flavoprotein (pyridoxamine 5'-phosphate oxidase superfamily)
MEMNQQDPEIVAKAVIDSNMYMVLGTADESGEPWATPVYYASAGFTEFYWVSSPEVRHSRNIAVRSRISIVIFNSQAVIGTGQGVYMSATAEQLTGSDLDRGIELFSRTSLGHGGHEWNREDVQAPALYRIYRATALEHWILDPAGHPDHRTPVTL